MVKNSNVFEYGNEFQQQLIAEIITDKKFGPQIIDIIEGSFFRNQYFGFIVKLIKEYYDKHEVIPNYKGLAIQIDHIYGTVPDTHEMVMDTLNNIQIAEFSNLNVTEIALKFCKFQRVRNTIDGVQKKLNIGDYEDYDEIEDIVRDAITFKEVDESSDFFTDVESALDDDYREPTKTGIDGVDDVTKGGLGKGELAVIIAPLGVGKTTILSLISSNAYLEEKNVLHIFFEDKPKEVKRKFITHWSGIPLEDLGENRERALSVVKDKQENCKGKLIFVKLPADSITIPRLRKIIKREKNKLNGKLDLVTIDYADCIVGDLNGKEEWSGEGRVMRSLETMSEEYDVAMWTAVQGGRASTTASIVQVDMIGGNIKKAQVAHFIMSIAKTLDQKEAHTATIAILKSRFGGDGRVFDNCTFDNNRMFIDTNVSQSASAFEEVQSSRRQDRIRNALDEYRNDNAGNLNGEAVNNPVEQ